MTARGNGLRASRYAVLVEIEESLGDPLLVALAERKIAAYVVPASGPGGATRLILHVDALRRIPAGIVLAGLTPAPAGERSADPEPATQQPESRSADDLADHAAAAEDAAFAEIVAGFDRVPDQRTWPDAEDIPTPPLTPPAPTFGPPPLADRRVSPPTGGSPPRPDGDQDADQDAEADHYSPPPLPRLDPPSRATRWALLALAVGIALLLLPTLFELGHRTSLDIAGVLCVVGAAGVLLTRLRDRSPDDPDDGAVV
jgi:hypothetical protein